MAIVNRNSAQNPSDGSRVNGNVADGYKRSMIGYVANAADDSATSIHRAVRVPSNANIRSVKLSTGDATTAGAIDIGVYEAEDYNDGAVIDADFFASALDLTGGPFVNAEQVAESGEYAIAERGQPLWEALGLSEDPNRYFDIAMTITTTYNGAAVGQLLEVEYVI